MCVVSAVTDFYRDKWPSPSRGITISWDAYQEYMRLKRNAMELDGKLNQPDCVKPEVAAWEREVEAAAEAWRRSNP